MVLLIFTIVVSSTLLSSALGSSDLQTSSAVAQHKPSAEVAPISYCDRDYSCVNCTAVRVCVPTSDGKYLYETSRFSCSSSNPYCNYTTGSCMSNPDPACFNTPNVTVSTNFTCMRNGYFPDPRNCSLYYYCQDEVAYQYSCTYPAPYYHPGLKYCVTNRYFCTDYSTSYYCSYNAYYGTKKKIYYTNNYYLYCGYNEILAVDRCLGSYYFDESAQMCLFVCPNAGLFPKNDDCANYFKCSPKAQGGQLELTNMTCPAGQAFLESEYMCVDRSQVPNCYERYPDLFSK